MPMDKVDQELYNAETDAQQESGPAHDADLEKGEGVERPPRPRLMTEQRREQLSRIATASTTSSGSSSSTSSGVIEEDGAISRLPTQFEKEYDIERHPTALSRIHTQRSQHQGTVGAAKSLSRRSTKPLPAFGGGKPFPPALPEREEYVVEFDGPDDPLHAQNWPLQRKLITGALLGYVTFVAAFGSSIFSTATQMVALEFGVGTEVGILGTSLYVLGFATGPILWAPFSELSGRRLPLVLAAFGMGIFNIAVAVGKDLQTVLICRFWAGFFGACPLTVVAAVFSDMFSNRTRGIAIAVFSITVFSGPMLSPFIGGFIIMNPSLGWRWTEYITAILAWIGFALVVLFLRETYPPAILVGKASELRRRTKNWGIHAKQEEIEVDIRELMEKNFTRPLRMLFTEPIVLLISIYMAFIYGLLYLFLTAYPIVFQQIHGFNPGVGGLPFFGIILGEIMAGVVIIIRQPAFQRKLAANGGMPVPEWRLPEVIVGGFLFAIGIFWFGWTGYTADIHWIAPALSGLCFGFGIMSIFLQLLNYLVDAYLMFAASAIAANTFLRSIFGAVFPLFATYMFDALKVNYTGTLLGCVAAVLVPVPLLFYWKGAKIRERSVYAPTFKPAE